MPRVSPEYLERRREEILAGARRAFARYGLEGATVARLEEEIGVSRGAIFHYFASKEDLFIALAERDSVRVARLLEEKGLAGVVRAIADEDPDWLGTYLEVTRHTRRARRAGELRDDVPASALARFLGIFLDGVFLQRPTIGLPRDMGPVLQIVEEAVAPR